MAFATSKSCLWSGLCLHPSWMVAV